MKKRKSEVILPDDKKSAKESKKVLAKPKKTKTYSSRSYKRKVKKETNARKRAEELAKLPKEPIKRFFAKLHPKRVFKWWFSWRGQKAILKFFAACFLIGIIFVGGLFLYYKKDLQEIQLDEMQISETVNTYLDRNGKVLWQDTGSEDYRLVVKKDEISPYMYQATVAIEDKNFYNHIGVDFTALVRAVFMTLSGQGVQGGSTLTQQLIKQVYFSDEAASANRGGVTRKLKELILAIELERTYSKDEIITMYLNQSPYGGRRNGVESAARTYFGKAAKDLNLAESALLAAVPNNPGKLNPYNTYYSDALVDRQHKVLDSMVSMGYISQEEADAAKQIAILDTIQPESNQYADMLAPHFVLEVKSQLEEKYGVSTMRAGGWVITTTLDYDAQKIAEEAVADASNIMYLNGGDNLALVSVDVETAQVISMVGSYDFNNVNYGEVNTTTQLLEPGSSIKPVIDYAQLFSKRDGINYSPGTILRDENIDSIYCAGNTSNCRLRNASNVFYGSVPIRRSLGSSLNIPAVKAMYINGIDASLNTAHALGELSYCTNGEENYGLSIAIGSGCRVRMVEHANAFASFARNGVYKELAYVLEMKNSSGDIIEKWVDKQGEQVIDPQVAYMLSSILSDPSARTLMGWTGYEVGYVVPDVWTACKTGTTTDNYGIAKDSWLVSYSTSIATVGWNGNHDGSALPRSNDSLPVRSMVSKYMERVHKEVYAAQGKWSYGDQPAKPAGIKTLTVNGITDIFPSWYDANKNSGVSKETLAFNRYNHLLASSCTQDAYKIDIEVTKTIDPMSGSTVYSVPEPYNQDKNDTCDYIPPSVSVSINGKSIIGYVTQGSYGIGGYTLYVDGVELESGGASSMFTTKYVIDDTESSIRIEVSDEAGYTASNELKLTPTKKKPSPDDKGDEKD